MKIPRVVSVLGTKYTVKQISGVAIEGSEVAGYCDTNEKLLVINKRIHKNRKDIVATFLHELGHAIWNESSLNQTNISNDVQEIIVDVFGRVISEIV